MLGATPISASVGYLGANIAADVRTVQDLLNRIGTMTTRGPSVVVDGLCGPLTIATIRSFQRMKHFFVDGRVDRTGPTLQALSKYSIAQATVTEHQGRAAALVSTSQAVASTTYVEILLPNHVTGPPPKLSPDRLSWFFSKLDALDKALQGNAKQSWGMIIWGEGSGEGSTATKAAPGAKIFGSPFDFKEFMDLIDLISNALPDRLPKGTSYRDDLENMRDELNAKKPDAAAKFILKVAKEIHEIVDEIEVSEADNKATSSGCLFGDPLDHSRPCIIRNLRGGGKVEVYVYHGSAQWVKMEIADSVQLLSMPYRKLVTPSRR